MPGGERPGEPVHRERRRTRRAARALAVRPQCRQVARATTSGRAATDADEPCRRLPAARPDRRQRPRLVVAATRAAPALAPADEHVDARRAGEPQAVEPRAASRAGARSPSATTMSLARGRGRRAARTARRRRSPGRRVGARAARPREACAASAARAPRDPERLASGAAAPRGDGHELDGRVERRPTQGRSSRGGPPLRRRRRAASRTSALRLPWTRRSSAAEKSAIPLPIDGAVGHDLDRVAGVEVAAHVDDADRQQRGPAVAQRPRGARVDDDAARGRAWRT